MTTWVHTSTLWHTLLNGFIKLDQITICSKHHLCPAFNDEFSPECWISGLSIYICWADLAFLNAWQWYFSHVLFLRSLLFFFFVCATHSMGDLSSPASQGLNPSPLQWKRGVLTTGPLGRKSLFLSFVSLFLSCTSNYQSLPQPPPGVHFLQ